MTDTVSASSAWPSISNDGRSTAFVSDADLTGGNTERRPSIFLHDSTTHAFTQITDAPSVSRHLAISGDGNRIAFVAATDLTGENADRSFELFVYDVPSGGLYQVTRRSGEVDSCDEADIVMPWLNFDGSRVMYVTSDELLHLAFGPLSDPTVVDLGHIGTTSNIDYSSNGNRIVVASSDDLLNDGSNADDNTEIFVIDLDASGTMVGRILQMTHTSHTTNYLPAISGDGSRIAFNIVIPSSDISIPNDHRVYRMDVAQGAVVEIPLSQEGGRVALDERGERVLMEHRRLGVRVYDFPTDTSTWLLPNVFGPVADFQDFCFPSEPGPAEKIPIRGLEWYGPRGIAMTPSGRFGAFDSLDRVDGNVEFFKFRELFPPVAIDDIVTVREDEVIRIEAFANDYDPNGLAMRIVTITNASSGIATFSPVENNGGIFYRPNPNFFGHDQMTYAVENSAASALGDRSELLRSWATVHIEVVPVNDAPVAAPEAYSLSEDSLLLIGNSGVLYNDADIESDPLSARLVSGPAHGILNLWPGGGFTYRPNRDYHGPDEFVYQAHDGQDGSAPTTVRLTVTAVNDPPVSVADEYATLEDTPLIVGAPGVLANDADVESDLLSVRLVSGPLHGMLVLSADGGYAYHPSGDYHGNDEFVYQAHDGEDGSALTTVRLTVTSVNDPPVNSVPTSMVAYEDIPVSVQGISVSDVDANEGTGLVRVTMRADGGSLVLNDFVLGGITAADIVGNATSTIIVTATPSRINTSLAAGLTYQGALDFSGADTLTIETNDLGNTGSGGAASDVDAIAITVQSNEERAVWLGDWLRSLAGNSGLSRGQIQSAVEKTRRALALLQSGRDSEAIHVLRSLAHEIHAFRLGNAITSAREDQLLWEIGSLIVGIGIDHDTRARNALLAAARDDVFANVAILRNLAGTY